MKLRITVHGVAYDVEVEVLDAGEGFPAAASLPVPPPAGYGNGALAAHVAPPLGQPTPPTPGAGDGVVAPVAGTVLEVKVAAGDAVAVDQIVVVVEAMKMNTNIASPHAGRVTRVLVAPGDAVREGQTLIELG